MKSLVLTLTFSLLLLNCTNSTKENIAETVTKEAVGLSAQHTQEVFTDKFGDQLKVIKTSDENKLVVNLNGKSYDLTKNQTSPGYASKDSKFLFIETKNKVTFSNKKVDMVLFYSDKEDNKMAIQ